MGERDSEGPYKGRHAVSNGSESQKKKMKDESSRSPLTLPGSESLGDKPIDRTRRESSGNEQHDDNGVYDNEFIIPEKRRRRWPIVITIIIIAIVATGGATYYYSHQMAAQHDEQRQAGYDLLNEAIALIQESDAVVVGKMDSTIDGLVTPETIPESQALLEQIPTTRSNVEKAVVNVNRAIELFVDKADLELAQHVLDAATYRLSLLDDGKILIEKDIAAINSLTALNKAWSYIVKADKSMRKAAKFTATGESKDIKQAIKLNRSAGKDLDKAQKKLTAAQEAFEQADFGSIFTYIALKKESAELATAADKAAFDADYTTATKRNEEFLKKDKEVTAAAEKIPSDPKSLITKAYDEQTAQIKENYWKTRLAATTADAFIRDYLRIDVETQLQ